MALPGAVGANRQPVRPPQQVALGIQALGPDIAVGKRIVAPDLKTGKKLVELKLDSPPVFDGLIAARERLFLSLRDGTVLCMGSGR